MEDVMFGRHFTAWMLLGSGATKESIIAVDTSLCADNRIECCDVWPLKFIYKSLHGIIDEYNYVMWGGMGFQLECCRPELKAAIKEQTGRM